MILINIILISILKNQLTNLTGHWNKHLIYIVLSLKCKKVYNMKNINKIFFLLIFIIFLYNSNVLAEERETRIYETSLLNRLNQKMKDIQIRIIGESNKLIIDKINLEITEEQDNREILILTDRLEKRFKNLKDRECDEPFDFVIEKINIPPVIDGILDDPCWEGSVILPLKYQIWPGENSPASEETLIYVSYDSENIYIACQAFDSEPDKIRASFTQRDDIWDDDRITIRFDTFYDQRSYYSFSFNPFGIQADSQNGDSNWDGQLTSMGLLNDEGYSIEIAIPFTTLKFPKPDFNTRWGLWIARRIERKDETISWTRDSRDEPNWQLLEGSFYGFEELSMKRIIEIMPVFVTNKVSEVNEDGNFVIKPFKVDPGMNMKFGLTSELNLDVTINPDFSQVEADAPQIDINTRFPIFISEKRPFFLEGRSIFYTPFNVVHTRNIVDPDYGVKLTGKVGKNTIGMIFASDDSPGKRFDSGEPLYDKNAFFSILRLKRDILEESEIGLIFTDKELDRSFNRVYGIDGKFRLGQYSIRYQALNSETLDMEGINSNGGAYYINMNYSGRNLYYGLTHNSVHPNFNASTGFVYRKGYRSYSGWIDYYFQNEDENAVMREWGPSVYGTMYYDYEGDLNEWYTGGGLWFFLSNQTNIGINADFSYLKYEGVDFYPFSADLSISSWQNENITGGFGLYYGDEINYDPDRLLLGKSFGYNMFLNFKIGDKLRSGFSYSKNKMTVRNSDEEIYNASVFRNTITYQFSKNLSFRNIIDYYTEGSQLGGNFLITWTPNPGTIFYIGYDTRLFKGDENFYQRDQNMLFMKFSYLFTL